MSRAPLGWLAALCCAVAAWGLGLGAAAQASAPAPAPEAAAAREILVLVRLTPQHFRPSSDYGGGYDERARAAQRRLAGRIADAHGLKLVSDWPMPLLGMDCFIMRVPDARSTGAVAQVLSHDPGVAWSQPVSLYRAEGAAAVTHNDPLFPVQPAAREWRLAELHQVATGRDVAVAVIDSGVETSHPDLIGRVALTMDFAEAPAHGAERHGTGIAGVIAATADNGLGIAGIAPHARLMALRACWQVSAAATVCDSLSLAKALHFAIEHRAQVINLSLGGPQDPLLSRLLDVALQRGATVVAAFDRDLPSGGFPASHTGVIAVADEALALSQPGVYSAPGRDVPTTQPGGRWTLVDGNSYAAAHVSGLVALLREHRRTGGGPIVLVSQRRGGGLVDACATLHLTPRPCDCACLPGRESVAGLRP